MNDASEGPGLQATMALQFVERNETAALDEAALAWKAVVFARYCGGRCHLRRRGESR